MYYETFEEMEEAFPYNFRGVNYIRLFIRGEDSAKRLIACDKVKDLLEKMLDSDIASGEIKSREVKIIDLLTETNPDYTNIGGRLWYSIIGNREGVVFVPIFHNSGTRIRHLELPQIAFDSIVPGIFSLTKKEYRKVVNPSKAFCYDVLEVD